MRCAVVMHLVNKHVETFICYTQIKSVIKISITYIVLQG